MSQKAGWTACGSEVWKYTFDVETSHPLLLFLYPHSPHPLEHEERPEKKFGKGENHGTRPAITEELGQII